MFFITKGYKKYLLTLFNNKGCGSKMFIFYAPLSSVNDFSLKSKYTIILIKVL